MNLFTKDVVGVFERFALLRCQVLVGQLECIAPASEVVLIWMACFRLSHESTYVLVLGVVRRNGFGQAISRSKFLRAFEETRCRRRDLQIVEMHRSKGMKTVLT